MYTKLRGIKSATKNVLINPVSLSFFSLDNHIFPFLLQIMTPFLTAKLAGQYVAVDAIELLVSTLQVSFNTRVLLLNYCYDYHFLHL